MRTIGVDVTAFDTVSIWWTFSGNLLLPVMFLCSTHLLVSLLRAPYYWPHYLFCLSVCPMWSTNSKRWRKTKVGIFLETGVTRRLFFIFEGQRLMSPDVENLTTLALEVTHVAYAWTADGRSHD